MKLQNSICNCYSASLVQPKPHHNNVLDKLCLSNNEQIFQIIINGQISSRPIILYEVLQKIGGCQIKFDEFCTKVFLSSWRLTWLAWDAIFSRTMR